MKLNLTLYHLTPVIDGILKEKRKILTFTVDLSKSLGVPLESLRALVEARSCNPPQVIDKSFSWSVELNESIVKKLGEMKFFSRTDFLSNLDGVFLKNLWKDDGFWCLASLKDKVLSYSIENGFKDRQDDDMLMETLKFKIKENNSYQEIPCLVEMMKKAPPELLKRLFDDQDFISAIQEKYIAEKRAIPLQEAMKEQRSYLANKFNPGKVESILGAGNVHFHQNEYYTFYTTKICSMMEIKECNSDWKNFDFLSYVDEVVGHRQIRSIKFKFNRELTDKEKSVFEQTVQSIVNDFNIEAHEIKEKINIGVLKLKLIKNMENTSFEAIDDIGDAGYKI